MENQNKPNPRRLAVKVLTSMERDGAYSNLLLRDALEGFADLRDKAFATELVYGVLQNKLFLDYAIDFFAKIKTKKMAYDVLNILRVTAYQILFLDRVPDSAAVNEGVKLAKRLAGDRSGAFVNGIARALCLHRKEIILPNEEKGLAVHYSFPEWMIPIYREACGGDCEQLLRYFNQPPRLSLRVNRLRSDREHLISYLKEKNVEAAVSPLCEDALLCDGFSIAGDEAYRAGLYSVQDVGAMLICRVLNPAEGASVIDACAGPGGKCAYLAEIMKDRGEILALDIYEHKKKLIEKEAKRLHLSIVEAKVQDARESGAEPLADYILADAPCSGLGIVGRKPEIKWNRKPEEIGGFAELQLAILDSCAERLKPGGSMVYSTCSLARQENEVVSLAFLSRHVEFTLEGFDALLPESLRGLGGESGMLTLLPHRTGTDGFFMAKFKKKGF